MKTKIYLTLISIVVFVVLCLEIRSVSRDQRVLGAFVHDFTMQAEAFEAYRTSGLHGATPSVTASSMKYIAEFQLPAWSVGSIGQLGSAGTKYFDSAPQSTQYCVTHLKCMVERERIAAIADLIAHLRRTTGRDLGDDPQKWIQEYASKN